MNYVITEIKSFRKEYTDMRDGDGKNVTDINSRMLTVKEYHILARRIIGRWAPEYVRGVMLKSEDAIDFVAHKIMMGDWGYDPTHKAKSKLRTYRGYCGKRAIQDYMAIIANQNTLVTNFIDNDDGEASYVEDTQIISPENNLMMEERQEQNRVFIKSLMEKSSLNDTQRQCVVMHYFQETGMSDIARQLNISREGVRRSIDEAIKTMRKTSKKTNL